MQIDPSVPGFTAMNVALVVLQALHVRCVFHAAVAQQTAARLCFARAVSRGRYTVVQICPYSINSSCVQQRQRVSLRVCCGVRPVGIRSFGSAWCCKRRNRSSLVRTRFPHATSMRTSRSCQDRLRTKSIRVTISDEKRVEIRQAAAKALRYLTHKKDAYRYLPAAAASFSLGSFLLHLAKTSSGPWSEHCSCFELSSPWSRMISGKKTTTTRSRTDGFQVNAWFFMEKLLLQRSGSYAWRR